MKVVPKSLLEDPKKRQLLLNEIKIHRELDNQNVVQMENYFEDDQNVYLLFELCINDSLDELINQRGFLEEFEIQYYLFQILQGLDYLHKKNIIHGNLNC